MTIYRNNDSANGGFENRFLSATPHLHALATSVSRRATTVIQCIFITLNLKTDLRDYS